MCLNTHFDQLAGSSHRVNIYIEFYICLKFYIQVEDHTTILRKVSFPKLETDVQQHSLSNCAEQSLSDDDDYDMDEMDEEEMQYNLYDSSVFISSDKRKYSDSSINPFIPPALKTKLTADRKRWTHIFPKGKLYFDPIFFSFVIKTKILSSFVTILHLDSRYILKHNLRSCGLDRLR